MAAKGKMNCFKGSWRLSRAHSPIPKIIHQTWETNNIPYDVYKKEWVESWKKNHPDWEYKLWTDEDRRALIKRHYLWFLKIYDSYELDIMRADAARYFILHYCGGLYADLDYECLKNIEPLISDYNLILTRMGGEGEKDLCCGID